MKIIIVRHGKNEWNVEKKAAGQVDIPLNDEGRKQAKETRIKNCQIDIYEV